MYIENSGTTTKKVNNIFRLLSKASCNNKIWMLPWSQGSSRPCPDCPNPAAHPSSSCLAIVATLFLLELRAHSCLEMFAPATHLAYTVLTLGFPWDPLSQPLPSLKLFLPKRLSQCPSSCDLQPLSIFLFHFFFIELYHHLKGYMHISFWNTLVWPTFPDHSVTLMWSFHVYSFIKTLGHRR